MLLKVPIAFSTALPALGTTIQWMADRIETLSGGSMRMKVYEPGKLVAPFEILDAVSTGKVNAGYATAGYWQGKMPAAALFSAVPFGPEAGEYLAWLYYGNGMKLYQEMYDRAGYNVKVLVCGIIAPETSGWFLKEIRSPADLKGLRMRFFGLGGKVMEKLGASVSQLPGGEIFPALEKGAIDATEFSMPAIDKRLGFYKIAKHNYFPGWHQQATVFELLINKDVWNGLSDHQKMVLEMLCRASVADSFAYGEAIQFDAMKENVEKHGVKLHYWNDEMLATFRKAWNEVAEEEAAKDEYFKKVWDDMKAFRKNYQVWQAYAFLPRPKPEEVEIK
ncbi:MAG: TRAP transporter substrate-binding protein [Candidatus Dadabacteria bacterium]|nr:MAG: TRAP transporter substrate-binding protein [Candidatus Dadabacteria bacterium]